MVRAELAFVNELVRRIIEDGLGSGRDRGAIFKRACAQQHETETT